MLDAGDTFSLDDAVDWFQDKFGPTKGQITNYLKMHDCVVKIKTKPVTYQKIQGDYFL